MDLKEALPILKLGTSSKNFPFHAPYVFSDGEYLRTNNREIHVALECACPFKGCVNFYVLEGFVKAFEEEYTIEQKKNKLILSSEKAEAVVPLIDIDFPQIPEPTSVGNVLTEETLALLNKAALFTSEGILEYVYIDPSCICGAAHDAVFLSEHLHELPFSKPLGLSNKIIKLLQPDLLVGEEENNLVIRFQSGYMYMSTFLVEMYPIDKIKAMVYAAIEGSSEVVNAAPVLDSLKYITPIMHGESSKLVTFTNLPKESKISISSTSIANGTALYEFNSVCKDEFVFSMNVNDLKKLDFGYNMYYNSLQKNKLIFLKEDSTIVFLEKK